MRAHIDRLMADNGLDAIVVLGDETPNTFRNYLAGRSTGSGIIVKKRGEQAVYIVNPMEIDEAAKSGLKVVTPYDLGAADIYRAYRDDPDAMRRALALNTFEKLAIKGRVAFYGAGEVHTLLPFILAIQDSMLDVELVIGGEAATIFDRMYETKDEDEVKAMKRAADLACQVVRRTRDFLTGHFASGAKFGSPVVDAAGNPLTIGAVKRFIRLATAELGLDDPEGAIFAQGRDAGMPHSKGEEDDVLQVGRAIVFDYFPRLSENGYFHDMTRTWVLGRAPAEVQRAYDDVMGIFHKVMKALKVGEPGSKYQEMTLDHFEARGHPTQRSHPGTMKGYVHSLGHGLGLNVHEAPGLSVYSKAKLAPGNVVTVEPGLYYPERGYGIRVEDTVYFDKKGKLHNLTDFPYDLALPLKVKR
ncbi:MAG: aminopeptidase P family protein [Anaerolineae bacterium]|nr:aminopeptidase P family protein [Anaerolineae bacterium]